MSDKKNNKKILIVESPTKVKTIKKFVGNKYKIMATKGHVKDLPKSRFGVDIENNFEPEYIIMRDKKKTLNEIKKEAKNAEEIYLATDPDREGEAICWHVSEEIKKLGEKKIKRVLFNEITKNAVIEALKNPKDIDMNLVNAQQARRVLDRIVGYKISPLLWKAIRKGLSAGRVQSVALKLIVDRQREIDKFIPEEYWSIKVKLETEKKETFLAKLIEKEGKKINIKNEEQAKNIESELKDKTFVVIDVQKKKRLRKPVPPFITSSMQQEASKKLKFTAQKTMLIAQQLYEGVNIHGEGQVGLITYMRTDSLRISNDALKECRDFINKNFGEEYLPETPNVYKSKKSSQDAHEAIRPTSVFRHPENIKNDLTPDQYKLYNLIWKRFIASQMKPAEFNDTKVKIKADNYTFQANGSIQIFDGFLKIYDVSDADEKNNNNKEESEKNILPDLNVNEKLNLIDIIKSQHFTQPPPQYTDATLVKALEEKDIGRPSTYAPIIATLVNRKYVIRDKGKFAPTELGILVSDILTKNFSEIINEEFTAKMEDNLDKVEEGKVIWNELIRNFYTEFEETLKKAEPNFKNLKKDIEGETGEVCELCGGKMIIKWGKHGKFLSCENYPKCKNAKPLNDKENKQHEEIIKDEKCPECGSDLVIKSGPFGKFIACSNYPQCKYTRQIIVKVGVKCPECGGDIIERKMRGRRKFCGCSNYPDCKFMVWDKPVLKTCPKCGNYFLLEKYKKNKIVLYCKNCDYKEEKNINDNE